MSVSQRQLYKAADILQRIGQNLYIQTMVVHGAGSDQWVYLYTQKFGPEVPLTDRGSTVVPPFKAEVAAEALVEIASKKWPDMVAYASLPNGGLTEIRVAPLEYKEKGGGI